jgi:hypothetical protein
VYLLIGITLILQPIRLAAGETNTLKPPLISGT